MSAQATTTDGKSWALSTSGAVPAENVEETPGTRPGRRSILTRGADIATAIDQSWRRRDYWWCAIPILLAYVCAPH